MEKWKESLGEPDIKLAGLQIWIHSRHDDGDYIWLRITAHCGAAGAEVWTTGEIMELADIKGWRGSAVNLRDTLTGAANLHPVEPNLSVNIYAKSLGNMGMEVSITPDNMTQEHEFKFEIDQSYLPQLITQCDRILEKFPVREPRFTKQKK